MNVVDVVLWAFTGFAVPGLVSAAIGEQVLVPAFGRDSAAAPAFVMQWLFAALCGPALLAHRLFLAWKTQSEASPVLILGTFAATGWAALYGYALLGTVARLLA
jgi:hypothetical protein